MLVLDNNGRLFDDRRKEERRKEKIEVDIERRKGERRTNTSNKKHIESKSSTPSESQVLNTEASSIETTTPTAVGSESVSTNTDNVEEKETTSSDKMSEEASTNQEFNEQQ